MDRDENREEILNKSSRALAVSIISHGAVLLAFGLVVLATKGKVLKKLL